MTIMANRPTAKSPTTKATKAARKAEEASWWTQPIPAQLSLGDAGKVDDRKPRLVAVPDGARANLWPTTFQLGQHLAELFEAGQADKLPEVARSCGVSIDDALTALRDHLVRTGTLPADSPIGVRPTSAVCPSWCADCWKGSEDESDPDPGTTFHHGEPLAVDTTEGVLGIELERLDVADITGEARVFIKTGDASVTLDQAEALANHLLVLVSAGRAK